MIYRNFSKVIYSKRNINFEILRIVAAFGIVAYHANVPVKDLPYAGLIVFLALSPLVEAKYNWSTNRSPKQIAKSLLVPWAFWLIVYAGANLAFNKPPFPAGQSIAAILYGSSPHLWFLPFIFVALCTIGQIKKVCTVTQVYWSSTIMTTTTLFTSDEWRPLALSFAVPYAQWAHAAAAVFGGIALGTYRNSMKFAWAGLLLIGFALSVCAWYAIPGISITYSTGLLLVVFAMFAPDCFSKYEKAIRTVSQCMFGVYLIHILAIAIVNRFIPCDNYLAVVFIFLVCLIGVFFTRRMFPPTKMVLG